MLGRIFGGLGLKLTAALAALAAVAGILLRVRQSGRDAERNDNLQRTVENANAARKIERDTRALDDSALDEFLRPPADRRR